MLMASRAGGGRLLEAEVTEGSLPVSVHAVRAVDGTTLVYLVNKSTDGTGGRVAVTPSEVRGAASAMELSASDLEAGAGEVTLGGKKIDEETGGLGQPDAEVVPVASNRGTYLVELDAASAVLLVIPAGS